MSSEEQIIFEQLKDALQQWGKQWRPVVLALLRDGVNQFNTFYQDRRFKLTSSKRAKFYHNTRKFFAKKFNQAKKHARADAVKFLLEADQGLDEAETLKDQAIQWFLEGEHLLFEVNAKMNLVAEVMKDDGCLQGAVLMHTRAQDLSNFRMHAAAEMAKVYGLLAAGKVFADNIEVVKADAVALGERLLGDAEPLLDKLKVDLVEAIVAAIQANQAM
tara:strand:+ start:218 stop:868 length:651 start_codon:yes stop_codon:yes gene_type:complete